MGLMNSISQGLSAAGYAGGEMYARGAIEDQRATIQAERDARLTELQEQSGIRAENRAVVRADQQRTAQTSRIDAAADSIADKAVEPKRGLINSRIEDKSTWTAEQQAAVDQSLAGDKAKVASDPKTRTQAAIATGDIAPKDAATMDSRAEIAAAKNDAYLQNVQAKLDMAADKLDMAKTIATIRAASGGSNSDGKDPANAKMIEYLVKNGTPREQATSMVLGDGAGKTKDPVGLAAQLATALIRDGIRVPKDAPAGTTPASYAMDIATQQIEAATRKLRPDGDAPKPAGAPAVAPAAKTTSQAALPAGAKQIGTSGGKPVYETPDGKRFIQK